MKDAKGHGSDTRGGKGPDSPEVAKHMKIALANAAKFGPDHPSVGAAMRDAIMAARPAGGFYKIPENGGQPVASNAHAAATLASGAKSAPVDTHPSMASPKTFSGPEGKYSGFTAADRKAGHLAATPTHGYIANDPGNTRYRNGQKMPTDL